MRYARADDRDIQDLLESAVSNVRSIEFRYSFRCRRTRNDGTEQEVTIHVLDTGSPGNGDRYSCVAEFDDGKIATGKPDDDLQVAISLVRWDELG
jgi:uncharacterized protein YajQ (UPF0234 family)